MPAIRPQAGLQGVISGSGTGFFPVDIEEVPKWTRSITAKIEAQNAPTGKIRRSDGRLVGLVDVAESEQLGSSRADITDLEDGLTELLLKIQVEVLGVGRANVLVRTKKITQRREPRVDRRTCGEW